MKNKDLETLIEKVKEQFLTKFKDESLINYSYCICQSRFKISKSNLILDAWEGLTPFTKTVLTGGAYVPVGSDDSGVEVFSYPSICLYTNKNLFFCIPINKSYRFFYLPHSLIDIPDVQEFGEGNIYTWNKRIPVKFLEDKVYSSSIDIKENSGHSHGHTRFYILRIIVSNEDEGNKKNLHQILSSIPNKCDDKIVNFLVSSFKIRLTSDRLSQVDLKAEVIRILAGFNYITLSKILNNYSILPGEGMVFLRRNAWLLTNKRLFLMRDDNSNNIVIIKLEEISEYNKVGLPLMRKLHVRLKDGKISDLKNIVDYPPQSYLSKITKGEKIQKMGCGMIMLIGGVIGGVIITLSFLFLSDEQLRSQVPIWLVDLF